MDMFRVKLSLFFISLCAVFFLAFNVVYGIDILSLTQDKQDLISDELYVLDLFQQEYIATNGKFEYFEKYPCGIYECEVHEYLAPPYTNNDRGYVLIMKTDEEIIRAATGKKADLHSDIVPLPLDFDTLKLNELNQDIIK